MICEADKLSVVSPHLIAQYCRTETRMASKLNRIEHHSYEVRSMIFEIQTSLVNCVFAAIYSIFRMQLPH